MIIRIDSIENYSDGEFEAMRLDMSAERQEKCLRYVRDADRKLCILADFITRQAVSEYLNIPARKVVIERDARGKPYIKNGGCFISYSHSGKFAAAAVSDKPVGIDTEEMRKVNPGSLRKFASENEKRYVADSAERFLALWTLKEAHLKCTGEGIRGNLKEIEFDFSGESLVSNIPGFEYKSEITDEYVLAVCLQKG